MKMEAIFTMQNRIQPSVIREKRRRGNKRERYPLQACFWVVCFIWLLQPNPVLSSSSSGSSWWGGSRKGTNGDDFEERRNEAAAAAATRQRDEGREDAGDGDFDQRYSNDYDGKERHDDDDDEGDFAGPPMGEYDWGSQEQRPSFGYNDDSDENYNARLDPKGPPPNRPPPPPPRQQEQQPWQDSGEKQRPMPPSATTVTFGNNKESEYTPIDYSFPSKDIKKSKEPEQKKKTSFFGWGSKSKEETATKEEDGPISTDEENESSRRRETRGDNVGKSDSYWEYDNDSSRRRRPPPGRRGDLDNDRPWVDPSVRPRPQRDYASARRDPVALYMSNSVGHRMNVYFWSTTAGAALGGYCGKSIFGNPYTWAMAFALLFGMTSAWARNPYGDWCRAVGLACWWTLVKSRRIRREYPTGRHFRAMFGIGPRRRFPPNTDNPWSYQASDDDEDAVIFEMWSALACMVLVGSMAGGAVPIIPSWMGALAGGASLAILTTRKDARGDLCRSAGMRVRRTMGLAWTVLMDDCQMPKLTGTMTRKILDKILILDRQHKLQDKLMAASSWGFNLVQNMIRQARGEPMEDDDDDRGDRRRNGNNRREPMEGDDRDNRRRDGNSRRGDDDYRGDRRRPPTQRRPPPDDRDGARSRRDGPPRDFRRDRVDRSDGPRRGESF